MQYPFIQRLPNQVEHWQLGLYIYLDIYKNLDILFRMALIEFMDRFLKSN